MAPIFHILHSIGGTLVLDEADFRFSDMKADMVKILNNGTVKGMPVLRCEKLPNQQFQAKAYRVFGPKIIATRGYYEDDALESRFISEEMGLRKPRTGIPYALPAGQEEEARHLRNKLLLFRFENLKKISAQEALADKTLSPRVNQMFLPLLALMDNEQDRHALYALGRCYSKRMKSKKAESAGAQLFEIIKEHVEKHGLTPIKVKELTYRFIELHVDEYERRITARWIGSIVREELHLTTYKSSGYFLVSLSDKNHLQTLSDYYGLGAIQRP